MRRTIPVIIAMAAAGAGTVHAQQHGQMRRPVRAPSGLVVNVHAFAMPGFSITGADIEIPYEMGMGPGMGAQIGYAFGPRYMLYAGVDLGRLGASADDETGHWGLGIVEVGGRMSFPKPASRVTPYVTAAVGRRGVAARFADFGDVKFHGMAISGGGGITYALSPAVALNAGAVVSLGKLGHYEDPEQRVTASVNNSTTARLQFGLDWRP